MAGVGGRLKRKGIYIFNRSHCCMAETNIILLERLLKENWSSTKRKRKQNRAISGEERYKELSEESVPKPDATYP